MTFGIRFLKKIVVVYFFFFFQFIYVLEDFNDLSKFDTKIGFPSK